MRIIDLYKMSEEERKKALEEQQSLYNERMRQSEEIGRQANQQFNDLISKKGEYDTSKHTTTIGDLRKAYKDSNSFQTVNNSLNNYSKNNSPSIWEKMGYIMDNFGTGVHQGTVGIAQGLFTDSANEMQKGKAKNNNELFNNFINAYAGNDLHHIAQSTLNTINEGINILNDKDKNLWQKMVDINLNTVSNGAKALLPMQGFYSSANQVIGKVSDTDQQLLEMNKNISEPLEERKKELANKGEEYDGATKFLGEAGQVIGNMIPSITASAITKNPSVALGVMGASVKGQATQEALDKGMSLDKATQIGDAKALIEVATEKLSGGTKVFGHGSLDDIAEELVKKGAKSKAGKFIMTQLLNAGGEIAEEEISNVLGNAIDKGTTDPDKKVLDMKEAFETMGSTAFTTTMLNLLTGGMVNDYRKISNNMNQYKDTNTGEILDNNSQDILKQAENIINENSTPNLQQQSTQNEQILPTQQINQEQNKVAQNGNMEQIMSTQNENRKIAIDEINNSRISTQEKQQMIEALNNIEEVSNEDIYAIRNVINEANKINQLPTDLNYKDNREARQKYAKYKNDNSNYDSTIVNEVLDTIPTNRNGRRTVKQWLQVANEIGTRIADKSDAEIEKIAYRSWFEEQPTKNITRYDNQAKTNVGFQKLTSDEWLNTINNAVNEARTNNQAQNNNSVKNNTITNNYAQSNENNTQNEPTKGETINWNEIERPEGKIRKHYRSIIESSNTTKEAKAIAKELMGIDTYMPDSNKKQLERANVRIENSTPDSELDSLMSRAKSGDKIDATDIAVGERLIQYYSKVGDKVKLRDSIQATAMAGTTAGQTVQAMALLNHQTPEGQVVWIQRSIEKLNNKMKNKKGDKAQQFEFTPEMQEKILNSKNKAELEQNLDEVYRELGQQVHKSFGQQVDSWRYFAMLGNPRTHIRNIVGNFLMGKAQGVKNKVAGTIEGTVAKFNPDMERTHTIVPASKEVLEFAKNDIENVASELELNENKYHPQSRIESNMRTFKSNAMENTLGRIFDINDTALEAEDGWGLKAGYKKALAEYMTANKLTPENITDTQLAKGRKYAIQQAKEATFHQANVVASAVNSFINKNKVTKAVGDALVPFVKTPANVAKAGVEYSPVGLTKSLIYDSIQLRKGNITVNQYIDNISKGLTGSAITVLGYALAQAGILKASGSDDDKKEKFDQQSGKQAYSIQVGDNTYTIDWLAPVGIPLMVGAEIYEGLSQKSKVKNSKSNDDNEITKQFLDRAEVLANSLSSTLDPMVEMSMISSLTSAIKSFAQNDTEALANMMTNGAKSYLNQFVPTLLGQVAKTTDTVERDTTSTATGTVSKAVDSTINQIKSKIPGIRQMLPTRKDIWGNDVKLADNWVQRFFEAGILPASKKQISNDQVVKNLNDLYDKNGNSNILPTTINKKIKIDGQDYVMTNNEYNKYKTDYGKTAYNLIKNLINSSDFKGLNNEQKEKAIENVYSYAKESNKLDYAKNNNLEVDESTLYKTMNELKDKGGNQSSYLNYTARTTGMEKEKDKNKVLANATYDDKTKSIIYLNGTGKDDKLYNNIKNSNIDINQYLTYKIQESEDKFLADKDSNGKSISGTAKKKVYDYVNSNITGYNNKLLLLGQKYKLTKSEQEGLAKHIYQISSNTEERNELFKYYSKNFTIKNGKVYYK